MTHNTRISYLQIIQWQTKSHMKVTPLLWSSFILFMINLKCISLFTFFSDQSWSQSRSTVFVVDHYLNEILIYTFCVAEKMFIGCLIKFTSNLAKNTDSEIQHLDSIILSIILRESYVLGMSLYGDVWRIYIRCEWSGGLHVVPQGLYSTCAATMTDVKYTLHITLFKPLFWMQLCRHRQLFG